MSSVKWGRSPQRIMAEKQAKKIEEKYEEKLDTIKKEVILQTEEKIKKLEADMLDRTRLIWALALRDEFGFSNSRMVRAMEKVFFIETCIADGLLDFEDIRKTIAEEIGVQV